MNWLSKSAAFVRANSGVLIVGLAVSLMVILLAQPLSSAAKKAAETITGSDIKNRSITGKDIKKGTLKLRHLRRADRQKALGGGSQGPQGKAGPKGKTGSKGKTGPKGATGAPGVSGLTMVSSTVAASADQVYTTVACPGSKKLVDSGYSIEGTTAYGSLALARATPVSTSGSQVPDAYSVKMVESQPVADSWALNITVSCADAS